MSDYSRALGERLRLIRQQQGLSLQGVEARSEGRWKAVVIGSYERGDRAITVARLNELADFYRVPAAELLPNGAAPRSANTGTHHRLVIDLTRLAVLPVAEVEPLMRLVRSIQSQRGDYNGRMLSLRADDLRTLALLMDRSGDEVLALLRHWRVLHDGEPAAV